MNMMYLKTFHFSLEIWAVTRLRVGWSLRGKEFKTVFPWKMYTRVKDENVFISAFRILLNHYTREQALFVVHSGEIQRLVCELWQFLEKICLVIVTV